MPTGGTIAAICTAPGSAARSMVRISGDDASTCARVLCKMDHPTRGVHRVTIDLGSQHLPALALWYPHGSSYTGEDTIEIAFVGNPIVARRVVDACLSIEGVRGAEPGEFGARAYLHGRLSLQQAEGIAPRIAGETDDALHAASALLDGSHGERCRSWTDHLAGLLAAFVEAGVDFTDQEDVVPIAPRDLAHKLRSLVEELESHLGARSGEMIRTDLPIVVLVGAPNAGKSTLMNALLGRHRVMVSDVAGTTRDVISERLDLSSDLPGAGAVMLTDLAGVGDRAVDAIDAAAQQRARETISSSDVIVWCDPTGRFVEGSIVVTNAKPTIRVRTKSDLSIGGAGSGDLAVCAIDGTALGVLRRAIADASSARTGSGVSAFVPRHRRAMMIAMNAIHSALRELDPDAHSIEMPELVASGMREALDALGELTGEITPDDVLGRVFSGFCVGK